MKKAINLGVYDAPFATRLRELMDEQNVTQKALGEETGLTRQAISQYADGSVLPNIERLLKIANYFGVSCDYMLGNTDVRKADLNIQQIAEYTGLSENSIELLSMISKTPYIDKNGDLDLTAQLLDIVNFLIETDHKYAILSSIHNYLMMEYDSLTPDYYNRKKVNFSDEELKDSIVLKNKMFGFALIDTSLIPYAMQSKIFDGLNKAKERFTAAYLMSKGIDEQLKDEMSKYTSEEAVD